MILKIEYFFTVLEMMVFFEIRSPCMSEINTDFYTMYSKDTIY